MNKKLVGFLGIVLSILILIYFETFMYRLIDVVGINISSYSNTIQIIVNIIIKLIMCIIIYLIYKKDFRKRNSRDNILKNLLYLLVSLVCITLIMYLFNYVILYIGDLFNIEILSTEFYNIFDKQLNFSLIIRIINDYIITPFLYCSIIILSVNKFCRRNDTCIVFAGLLASIVYAFTLTGTLSFVIFNSLSIFLLFSIFAYLYRKTNSILFIITLYSFYLLSNVIIINYLGW